MNKFILFSVLTAFLSFQSLAQANTEVARVNDKVITSDQVNAALNEQMRSGAGTASKKTVLEELIKREVAVQEARKMKLENDPETASRIDNVLMISVLDKKLGSQFEKMNVSDAESKNWYDRNPEIRTSHVFISLAPSSTADDEQKAAARLNQIAAEIRSGKISFAEAAQKYSEDPSNVLGGDLDYRMKDRLDAAYFRAAQKLGKPGDTTGPVRSAFGLHLIRLTGKHTWAEVDRARVKKIIYDEKRQEVVGRYLNDLRQKAKVTINEKAL